MANELPNNKVINKNKKKMNLIPTPKISNKISVVNNISLNKIVLSHRVVSNGRKIIMNARSGEIPGNYSILTIIQRHIIILDVMTKETIHVEVPDLISFAISNNQKYIAFSTKSNVSICKLDVFLETNNYKKSLFIIEHIFKNTYRLGFTPNDDKLVMVNDRNKNNIVIWSFSNITSTPVYLTTNITNTENSTICVDDIKFTTNNKGETLAVFLSEKDSSCLYKSFNFIDICNVDKGIFVSEIKGNYNDELPPSNDNHNHNHNHNNTEKDEDCQEDDIDNEDEEDDAEKYRINEKIGFEPHSMIISNCIMAGSDDNNINFWDHNTGTLIKTMNVPYDKNDYFKPNITAMSFSSLNNKIIIANEYGKIYLFDLVTEEYTMVDINPNSKIKTMYSLCNHIDMLYDNLFVAYYHLKDKSNKYYTDTEIKFMSYTF